MKNSWKRLPLVLLKAAAPLLGQFLFLSFGAGAYAVPNAVVEQDFTTKECVESTTDAIRDTAQNVSAVTDPPDDVINPASSETLISNIYAQEIEIGHAFNVSGKRLYLAFLFKRPPPLVT